MHKKISVYIIGISLVTSNVFGLATPSIMEVEKTKYHNIKSHNIKSHYEFYINEISWRKGYLYIMNMWTRLLHVVHKYMDNTPYQTRLVRDYYAIAKIREDYKETAIAARDTFYFYLMTLIAQNRSDIECSRQGIHIEAVKVAVDLLFELLDNNSITDIQKKGAIFKTLLSIDHHSSPNIKEDIVYCILTEIGRALIRNSLKEDDLFLIKGFIFSRIKHINGGYIGDVNNKILDMAKELLSYDTFNEKEIAIIKNKLSVRSNKTNTSA